MKASRGKGRSSNNSRGVQRRRIGTPGKAGIDFEAAVGNGGDSSETVTDTFSYDDVSDLSTLKPAVSRAGKGGAPKAIARASGDSERTKGEGANAKRQEESPEDTSTEEEERGGAARRNRRRKAAAAAAAKRSTASGGRQTTEGDNGPNSTTSTLTDNNGINSNSGSNGTPSGNHLVQADAAVVRGVSYGAENGGMSRASRGASGDGAKRRKKVATRADRAQKLLPYPEVPFVLSGKARNMTEVLEEAVTSEIQGLIRKRGHEPACKEAVKVCVDVAKEIHRQAADIAGDLDPLPQFNIKGLRKVLEQQRQRQRSVMEEEMRMWDAEEKKCLARAERNKRAQAKLDAGDSYEEVMQALGGKDKEQEDPPPPLYSEGVGTEKRVSDKLLSSTIDMLLNARAIGRSLQETGAGCADAQEVKERLGRAYQQYAFKNYPNVHDPKAGIASMLK